MPKSLVSDVEIVAMVNDDDGETNGEEGEFNVGCLLSSDPVTRQSKCRFARSS